MNDGYYQIYRDRASREWHWRLRADNNKDVASSAKGYKDRDSAEESISIAKRYSQAGILPD